MHKWNRPSGPSGILSVILILFGLFIWALILFPMFFRTNQHIDSSNCQSNLKQINYAIKMYLVDWNDTYPTNRAYISGNKTGPVSACVRLSPVDENAQKPFRFKYGVSWVEALYDHIDSVTKQNDPQSVWRCLNIGKKIYPKGSDTAATSYVFNSNLIEKRERIIRDASKLMLIREINGLVNSELRPTNNSTWTSKIPPDSPFLTSYDSRYGKMNPELHGNGSHILFADGHVKLLQPEEFPSQKQITKARCWDSEHKQWLSNRPHVVKSPYGDYTSYGIAITP